MKNGIIAILWISCLLILGVSCNDDEAKIEGKWQLIEIQQNTSKLCADSVFFNFQKGICSIVRIRPGMAQVNQYFGNYSLKGDSIHIQMHIQEAIEDGFNHDVGWDTLQQDFKIAQLTAHTLQLNHKKGEVLLFQQF